MTQGSLDSFSATVHPPGTAIVYLRNGDTRYLPATENDQGGKGDWKGWGFRKVAAKHGWGPAVAAQVALVLGSDPKPRLTKGGWDPESEWHNDDGSWDEPEDVAHIIERDLTLP